MRIALIVCALFVPGVVSADLIVANSQTDFALSNGQQGQGGWYYGYHNPTSGAYNGNNFTAFPADQGPGVSATDFWTGTNWDWGGPGGNPPYIFFDAARTHPDTSANVDWSIRRYVTPVDGTVDILVNNLAKYDTTGGNGIIGRIYVNGVQIYSQTINANDGVGVSNVLAGTNLGLPKGSRIDFIVDANANISNDGTTFIGSIFLTPALAPEPGSIALMGIALIGIGGFYQWRRRSQR